MKTKPILFSGPMVRALLGGRKTQTRRVLKDQSAWDRVEAIVQRFPNQTAGVRFAVGDVLWVREAFSYDRLDVDKNGILPPWFWADGNPKQGDWTKPKPSIHMPRKFSRLTLAVTEIRVQRLKDISEADAIAEGIRLNPVQQGTWTDYPEGTSAAGWRDPRRSFESLWSSINGMDSWYANPWVVAISFTVHKCNVDIMAQTDHMSSRFVEPEHTSVNSR